MPRVRLPSDWQPRDYQRPAWDYLENGGRRAVLAWHRRAGKDEIALHRTAVATVERPATYWHLLPEASQARKAIWDAVNPHSGRRRIDEAFPPALRDATRDNEMFLRLRNGSTWQVVGSDNFDSLVGSPPAGVVFSEYALADPRSWALLRPILLENGGWALFISSVRGRNHFKALFDFARVEPGWFGQLLTVDDSRVFTPEQLAAERREMIAEHGEDAGDGFYRQEYYCDFSASLIGAYYGREMERADREERIGIVPADPGKPCVTGWDLGIGDSTVIWIAQQVGLQLRVLDVVAGSGVGLEWYAGELRRRGYDYERHYLPHDAEARELGTGRSREETLKGLRIGPIRIVPRQDVDDGINATRRLLPSMWFNEATCGRGIEAMRQYRREWDDRNKVFALRPKHDWASHFADAMRTLAMGLPKVEHVRSPAERTVGDYLRGDEKRKLGWVV